MKANELRLGNYVLYTGEEGGVVQVSEIGNLLSKDSTAIGFNGPRGGYSKTSLEDGADNWEDEEDKMIQPIPVTKEWLLKLGFKSYSWGTYFNLDPGLDFTIEKVKKVYYIIVGHDHPESPGIRIKADYVHNLQNLHFAITGKGLTIKEEV